MKSLTCPSGQYVVGIGARGALLVDEFSIACQKIPVSGAPGARGGFKSAGPGGGTASNSGLCARGHAVSEIVIKSGIFVDRIGQGRCYPREGDGWKTHRVDGSYPTVDIGGPGGFACELSCPAGEALYKVTVKYGNVVDSIRGECRK